MMQSLLLSAGQAAACVAACLAVSITAAPAAEMADLSDASRILSIGGSVTEIVYALGEEDRLVARDTTSVYPEAAQSLPDVGYMRALSPEGVLSVDPDGILMLESSGPAEAIDVLRDASVPMVTVPERYDLQGILEKVRIIGEALGVEERAAALARGIEHDLGVALADAAGPGNAPRILFVLSLQGGKIMASGTGTAADGIIRMVGAENAITEYSGYKQLSAEALIMAAPDVILTMAVDGVDLMSEGELLTLPAMAATPAGRAGRIIAMPGLYLLGFGPRTADAVHDLALALHEVEAR